MEYLLQTEGLSKRFKGQDAVADASMHVPEGSVYGLLGPNGAGKSTLLKMICGMLRPTEGTIAFAGRPWSRSDLYDIGSLVETPPLQNLTARENLLVRTTLLGLPEERIGEALRTVDLEGTGEKRAGQFSLGMKQRLGIALALLARPRLLVLDEPANGLDPIGIDELRTLVRSFPAHGVTVIVSSHILSEIAQTADRVGIIANGRLAYEGDLDPNADLERLFMSVCGRGRRMTGAIGFDAAGGAGEGAVCARRRASLRAGSFAAVLKAEVLKGRHAAPRKIALVAPLPFCALGVLASGVVPGTGAVGGLSTCLWNYWYALMMPVAIALVCASVANLDARQKLRPVLALPFSPRRTWWAKTAYALALRSARTWWSSPFRRR